MKDIKNKCSVFNFLCSIFRKRKENKQHFAEKTHLSKFLPRIKRHVRGKGLLGFGLDDLDTNGHRVVDDSVTVGVEIIEAKSKQTLSTNMTLYSR